MNEAGTSRIVARVALVLAAMALAWLAIRSAAQLTLGFAAPAAALSFAPPDGASLANVALARVTAAGGAVDAESRRLYRAALERQPLSATALALAGLDANATGDTRRARLLMEAAQHRDPRVVLPRIWLFNDYMQSRDLAAALDEVGPLSALQSNARGAVSEVLTAMAMTAEGRAALRAKLATNPFWRSGFFQAVVQNPSAQFGVLALLVSIPPNSDPALARAEQMAVFGTLVSRNQGARAYQAWHQSIPPAYAARAGAVYDGSFAGWPGAPPFNWALGSDGNGRAERVSAPGMPGGTALSVRFTANSAMVLASQMIRLAPGTHRLQVIARRPGTEANAGRLAVTATCQASQLASLPLDDIGEQPRRLMAGFTVSPTCDLVTLQIVGTPGESVGGAVAELTGIAVDP